MEINCQNLFGQEIVVSSPRQNVQDINLILMFGGGEINNRFYVGERQRRANMARSKDKDLTGQWILKELDFYNKKLKKVKCRL